MLSYPDSYYAATLNDHSVRPALQEVIETEVCIVGGGLAGLSSALELAERGINTTLLEAHHIAWGASGRNGGFVGPGFSLSETALIEKVGLGNAKTLFDLSRRGCERVRERIEHYGIDCGPTLSGGLRPSWFDDTDSLKREREFMLEHFEQRAELWPRERVREVLVSQRYYDALFKADSFQFHPLNYSRGLARACEQSGVRLYEASPVTSVALNGNEKRIFTSNGHVRCKHVIFACGGYIGSLVPELARAIVPVATYVIATETLGERIEDAVRTQYSISDNKFANDYYRRLPDTRLLWGGRISVRRDEPPNLSTRMLGDLLKVYPQLSGVRIDYAWHGLMSYASHKMPQIGQLKSNVWYAMGFGGHGMNTTAMAGELLATAIGADDQRYQLFQPFGLTPTAGVIGRAAAQTTYWYLQLRDALRA